MRHNAFLCLLCCCFLATASTGLADGRLTPTNFGTMEPVTFDHTSHAEDMNCESCHHLKGSGGAHRCGACHQQPPTRRASLSLENAAHKPNIGRCWSCHLAEKARRPMECEECHRG